MSTVAIWNPASGSAPAEADLREVLGADVDLVPTTAEDPGPGQARDAVENGADVLIACGGDGTVRACLDPLAGSETALAVVPLGTGNLLASNIGVADGLSAGEGAGRGSRRTIDIGRINGEAFAVMAGSGFDALMIRDASDEVKSRFGTIAYVLSAVKHLRTRLVRTEVEIDGEHWFTGRTSLVLVGNFGEISGGIKVFPDAVADDGLLDVAVMSANTLRDWAHIGWSLIRKQPPRLDLARRTTARRITVTLAEPRPYELDGEERAPATRLDIEVEPSALTLHQEKSNP